MSEWLRLCLSKSVVPRAAYSALIVGTLLIAINHGDALARGELDFTRLWKMGLTLLVPYGVSTVSSVLAVMQPGPPGESPSKTPPVD